jgi:uncharacterized protein (DUF488 family)
MLGQLFSIGHGARKAEEFLSLLKKYKIKFLIDVRSKPFSRFHPQFNRNQLDPFLKENDIKYVFMGDTLGGRPEDKSCYNAEAKVDYNLLQEKDFFKAGIERLKAANELDSHSAIMCSERNPFDCHRFNLIGRILAKENIFIQHINEKGEITDQEKENKSKGNLFGF